MKLIETRYDAPMVGKGRKQSAVPEMERRRTARTVRHVEQEGERLANAVRGTSQILSKSMRQSTDIIARGDYEAEKARADMLLKRRLADAKIEYDYDVGKMRVMVNTINNVTNLVATESKRYNVARQNAKATAGIATYQVNLKKAASELTSKSTINIDNPQYSEIDFEDIDPSDITEMIDDNGNPQRFVPTHLVSEKIFNEYEKKLRKDAMSGINGNLHIQEMQRALNVEKAKSEIFLLNKNTNYLIAEMDGKYRYSIDQYARDGDIENVEKTAAEALANGVWDTGTYHRLRTEAFDTITFDSFATQIENFNILPDGSVPVNQIELLKNSIRESNHPQEHALVARLESKKSNLLQQQKENNQKLEDVKIDLIIQQAQGSYNAGKRPVEAVKIAKESAAANGIPYRASEIESRVYRLYSVNDAEKNRLKIESQNNWWNDYTAWREDEKMRLAGPPPPLPAEPTQAMREAFVAGVDRRDITTDINVKNKLTEMITNDPEAFKRLDLRPYSIYLDDPTYTRFNSHQATMRAGATLEVQERIRGAGAALDKVILEVYGPKARLKDWEIKEINQLETIVQADITKLELERKSKNLPVTAMDYNEIYNKVFRRELTRIEVDKGGWFSPPEGEFKAVKERLPGTARSSRSVVMQHADPIINLLYDFGIPPTSDAVVQTYNQAYELGNGNFDRGMELIRQIWAEEN